MKLLTPAILSLIFYLTPQVFAQSLTDTGSVNIPISVTPPTTNQIFTATNQSHVCTTYVFGVTADNARGQNITVGDIFSLNDGTQFTVDAVDSGNMMTSYHISTPAYSATKPTTANTWAGTIQVANSNAKPPCMSEESASILIPRTLSDVKSDLRTIRDFGARMDGTDADKQKIQLAYDATPDGGVINIPCDSVWPVNPMANLGDWSPTHTNGKSVVYFDTCGMKWNGYEWGGWPYMDHAIGDDDLKVQVAKGVFSINRQEFNEGDNHPPLSIGRDLSESITYAGGGAWGGAVYPYLPSVMITTRNGASGSDGKVTGGSVMGLKTETQTYSNQTWSVQDVAFMPTARRYGLSSIWSFSSELDDETGLPASSKFEETNEIDIAGNGAELPSCVYDPKECARMPLYFGLAHRTYSTWAPNTAYSGGTVGYPFNAATNSTAWTKDTWSAYFVPTKVTATDTSGIVAHYQAMTTGTSGSTAPAWPTTNGDTVCDGPKDLEGNENCSDPTAAFVETPTVSTAVASGSTSITVSSVSDIGVGATVTGAGIADATTVSAISGNVLTLSTATTASISEGETLTISTPKPFGITWKRLGDQQTVIGTPVWFNVDDEYLDVSQMTSDFKFKGISTGPYRNYLTSIDTGISGNAPIHNAFIDISWSTMVDDDAVGIRMGPSQRIDFSNLWIHGDGSFKNAHVLGYDYVNQNDTRCGFVINDQSKSTNQETKNDDTGCAINWLDGAMDSSQTPISSSTTQITPDVLSSTYNIEGVWGYRSNGYLSFGIYDSGPAVLPKMTKSAILAIKHPRTAMLVYDTDDNEYVYYNSTAWKIITPGDTLQ